MSHYIIWLGPVPEITTEDKDKVTVKRKDYESFCKEFIFNQLRGEHFGESFCKRFGISDTTISILKDEVFTKQLIESLGYIK